MTLLPESREPTPSPNGGRHASHASRPDTPSLGELASLLSSQVSRLARDEIALAQLEAKQRARRVGAGAGMFGLGGMLAFFGAACAVAAAVIGLANVIRPWFAALVVAGALFVLAGLVVLPGWKSITAKHPDVAHDSVESVKRDVAVVKEAIKR
ncbi:MAG: hypothetical protein QOE97_1448 [Pseudonocardiales bacterium]|jgi:hypothetical protein|nr:hypothetical protein [Pseudonocardiales bacterium]